MCGAIIHYEKMGGAVYHMRSLRFKRGLELTQLHTIAILLVCT